VTTSPAPAPTPAVTNAAPASAASPAQPPRKKLSYKEQREFDALPGLMAALETEQTSLQAQLADGQLYASATSAYMQLATRLAEVEAQWLEAMERWEALGGG